MREKGRYAADRAEGEWTSYHPGGARALEGTYAGGLNDGTWVRWDPGGTEVERVEYEAGRPVEGREDGEG